MAFEKKHEGMKVLTQDGDEVGTIQSIEGTTAHVTPDAGLSESIRRRLGWDDDSTDTFQLSYSKVARVKDDEVHLKQ